MDDKQSKSIKCVSITGTRNRYETKKSQGIQSDNGIKTDSLFWGLSDTELNHDIQLNEIKKIDNNEINNVQINTLIKSCIKKKLSGYKQQDILHNVHDNSLKLTYEQSVKMLADSNLTCIYCEKDIYVLYRNVRYEYQWSIDRIDNCLGHTLTNSVISCLKCNLERRNISKSKFENTKKLTIQKSG